MVGGEQGREHICIKRTVCETELGGALDFAIVFQDAQIRVESNLAERKDSSQMDEQFELTLQIRSAIKQLLRSGFIVWRRTMCGGCDPGIAQFKAILCMDAFRL